jgi:uncharacterized protein (TIGR02117 family)
MPGYRAKAGKNGNKITYCLDLIVQISKFQKNGNLQFRSGGIFFFRNKIHMKTKINHVLLILCLINLPLFGKEKERSYSDKIKVYVVQQAWHTGIILPVQKINPEIWPEVSTFDEKKYVDVSWGDEKFYQAPGSPVFLAARAIFWPTRSVMRIYPFSISISSAYTSESRLQEMELTQQQFDQLTRFFANSLVRDKSNQSIASEAYGRSRYFFLSKRKYHLFRTCNTWVALAFKKAGMGNRSCCVLNANQLFRVIARKDSCDNLGGVKPDAQNDEHFR